MGGPLEGIRIADFTVHNAGPFCTHMLSQLGAEVIKVESAMRPDAFRKPHPVLHQVIDPPQPEEKGGRRARKAAGRDLGDRRRELPARCDGPTRIELRRAVDAQT